MRKLEMEDEYHFCMPRSLTRKKKKLFYSVPPKMSPNEIFMFVINPPNQRPESDVSVRML